MESARQFKDYMINNGETIITTTKAVEIVDSEQILDVEILLPVSYRIPCNEPFVFKEKIKIVNALYVREDDITKLQDTMNYMNKYILDNKLQPITSAYLVQSKQDNKMITDIYIGINPNVL
ncbi:MAG: hypothetical protein PHC56_09650 [Herbinix sp.]|nr:hypothetical protein [Herbinix sp.]